MNTLAAFFASRTWSVLVLIFCAAFIVFVAYAGIRWTIEDRRREREIIRGEVSRHLGRDD